jgi:hypothetical protein
MLEQNIMLYWLTNTVLRVSSLEDATAAFFNVKGVSSRVAVGPSIGGSPRFY